MKAQFGAITRFACTSRLGQIRAPVLIVHGRSDGIAPVCMAEQMHALIPGSRLVLTDGGHLAPILSQHKAAGSRGQHVLRHTRVGRPAASLGQAGCLRSTGRPDRDARGDDSTAGEVSRAEDEVMEMTDSTVLLDPAFTVPAVAEAATGVGWVRFMVPRFCEGEVHARRRALTERVIAQIGLPQRLSSPTATLLAAMSLPPSLERDVATVALAYLPHMPVAPGADDAADRLAAACGGRAEEAAARVCVLLQAHTATLTLIARRQAGDDAPAVPTTRRITPDGHEILVDLATAPFGAGRHACPGRALALHLAGAAQLG